MPFGFSKLFAFLILLSFGLAYVYKDWKIILMVLGGYAIIKIIWNLLTR